MRLIIAFLLSALLLSCQEEVIHPEDTKAEPTKKGHTSKKEPEKSTATTGLKVKDLIEIFDSIYQIKPSDFFSLKPIDLENAERKFALALNNTGLSEAKSYGVFTILEYKNHLYSENAFSELALLVEQLEHIERSEIDSLQTKEGFRLFYDILSKSGSIFILKDQFIIHKFRRCNDNYMENELKEDQLLASIYPAGSPDKKHFIRNCCSCPKNKGRLVK